MTTRNLRVLETFTLSLLLCAGSAWAGNVDLTKPIPKIETKTPEHLPATAVTPLIDFSLWKSSLDVNDIVGKIDSGIFCSGGEHLLYSKRLDNFLIGQVTKAFREESIRLGFSLPESTKSVFDAQPGGDANFRLGATLMALDYRTCGYGDAKGDVYTKIKWELFSVRRQKVVYSSSIEAVFSAPKSIAAADFDRGLGQSAVANLLADPKFVEVVASGGAVDATPAPVLAPLQIQQGQLVSGGVVKAAGNLLAAVVTIESGVGSGTAFYISQEGYLLTNQHVVADAKFVRVKLAGGKSLVGEVLRVDRQRDVALVRTDPVQTGVLNLRRDEPRVGEEVYALGSPFGEVLSGTLTRGVLSSKRVLEGVAYLQSDVAINPGNSGGPLIDANGHVLGITRLGSNAQGINMFIPVEDALDKLALTITPKSATAPAK